MMAKCYVSKSGKAYFPYLDKNGEERPRRSDGTIDVMGERNGRWYGPIRVIDPKNFQVEDRPRPQNVGAA